MSCKQGIQPVLSQTHPMTEILSQSVPTFTQELAITPNATIPRIIDTVIVPHVVEAAVLLQLPKLQLGQRLFQELGNGTYCPTEILKQKHNWI